MHTWNDQMLAYEAVEDATGDPHKIPYHERLPVIIKYFDEHEGRSQAVNFLTKRGMPAERALSAVKTVEKYYREDM